MKYIVSAGYSSQHNSICLKLYDDETDQLEDWEDTNFKAYCFTDDSGNIHGFENIVSVKPVIKYDAITDSNVTVWKVEFDDPFSVKQTHPKPVSGVEHPDEPWNENHIKFYMSYIYDKQIELGMPYSKIEGKLMPHIDEAATDRCNKLLTQLELSDDVAKVLIRYFEYPVPNFRRAALDIEVLNEKRKIPRPEVANLPVICIGIRTKDKKIAFMLVTDKPFDEMPDADEIYLFSSEKTMLECLFRYIQQFPVILTFNGDSFDLPYLKNRALRLGVLDKNIPFEKRSTSMFITSSIHLDLYRFFSITAIKNYAFQGRYKSVDLDTLSKLLLKRGKLNLGKKWVGDMAYKELLDYCLNDADLTYSLSTVDNNLVINLMIAIVRISRLPIESVCRKAVGGWIASFLCSLHRSMGYLIPRTETIEAMKGGVATKAIIKGKQYKGAVVIQPEAGTYFDCVVVDFGSLYPSILKNYNIGYETINCPHEECKKNTFAGLPHWICTKKKALEAIFIGNLRDLRLSWYKKKSKDKELDEAGKNWYKVVEQTIKVFMNASYGVFASASGFIFYCPPASEEIAGIARYIIQETAAKAKEIGLNIIYGDTDSLVIHKPDREKLKVLQEWAEKTWEIDLELDKEYRYMCFSERKKNYIGVKANGEVDVKGMTGKKSHTPRLFKETFEEIKKTLGGVHDEKELLVATERIRCLVQSVYRTLKRRQWENLSDLAFHVTVNKRIHEYGQSKIKGRKCGIPQHIKAVKLLQASGVEFEAGSVIEFIKSKNDEGVLPLELAKDDDVDIDKYVEFMESTYAQILEPIGINFNDVLGIQRMDRYL